MHSFFIFFRIKIVGVKGKNSLGHITIDDISFVESQCALSPPEVIDELAFYTTTAPTTTVQVPASDEVTCNFDQKNTCGWIDDTTSNLKWTLNKGSTSSSDTGPTFDVSGSGYYIYLETSGTKEGDKARILSPMINSTLAGNERNFKLYLIYILNIFLII